MKKAPLHPQELDRLMALNNLQIMDSISEREFDELTLIASEICNTPIALISLIDEKRQWFKSKVGLSANETPKDLAFCAHAILQNDIFMVNDATKDERFFDNPLVTDEPYIQFYAGAPILDPNSNLPIGTLCVIDNKPRKLTQKQLEALKGLSNQVYKLLELRLKVSSLTRANQKLLFQKTAFDHMSEGVVLQDKMGNIIDYNPAALKVLGVSAERLNGKTSNNFDWNCIRENGSIFPAEEHPSMVALRSGQFVSNVIMGIQLPSEKTRWISITSTPLFLDNGPSPSHSVTTFADISQQRIAQQALFQNAKMTSLGEMAGGIAHEINTPLAIIISAAGQALNALSGDAPKLEMACGKLNKIDATAVRISKIVRGLRLFSHDSEGDPLEETSMKQIIMDSLALCAEKYNYSGIKLEVNISDNIQVLVVPTQISQVILNLLNNAFDALEKYEEKWVKITLAKKDHLAQLKITDSGKGIPKDLQTKIMQPFFTTKEVGKGTGLALSISKGLIESFKGHLYYDDSSENTCFIVELPLFEKTE